MKLFIAFLLISTRLACAEAILAKGGRSPDGRFEVRIFETNTRDPSNYYYAVTDTKSGKVSMISRVGLAKGFW